MLLNCFISYAQTIDDKIPSTGEVILSDTTVNINIDYIRIANAKMIEHKYLLSIINEQDTIINMKDKYINEQQKIIDDFKYRLIKTNEINTAIRVDLEKQKKRNKIITYCAGSTIVGLIIGLIIK